MNKYQKAIEVIDTLFHLMCGEEREDGYKPTMEEMSNSMDLLKDLANKADSFEWIPVSERLPEPPKGNQELDYSPFDVYLVSINEGYPFRAFWDGKNFGDGMFKLDVKAWMPLPKPYEDKENDSTRNVHRVRV